jgi:hypothetical protein
VYLTLNVIWVLGPGWVGSRAGGVEVSVLFRGNEYEKEDDLFHSFSLISSIFFFL